MGDTKIPELHKWQDDYNKAIRADITLPQYQKRFAEWMSNWIELNSRQHSVELLNWMKLQGINWNVQNAGTPADEVYNLFIKSIEEK